MTIKLIVGLANPGKEYEGTRHNAGSWYINLLSKRKGISLDKNPRFFGYTSKIKLFQMDVRLLIPTTFMNLSGKAVSLIANFYHINPDEILVAHDELNLPPGIAKFKVNSGHNGHNGLKDIIQKLGNNCNFYRLSIGVGHPGNKNEVINFVLDRPTDCEKKLIDDAIQESVYCTDILLKDGLIKATNRLHSFRANKY